MTKNTLKQHEVELLFKPRKKAEIFVKKTTTDMITTQKKSSPVLGHYVNCLTFKVTPITQTFLRRFARGMIEWARSDEMAALKVSQFYLKKGILPSVYKCWIKEYPIIEMANEFAVAAIASNREIGALKKQYSVEMVMHSQHQYDPMYEQIRQDDKQEKIDIWQAKHPELAEKKEVKSVVIGSFPTLDK